MPPMTFLESSMGNSKHSATAPLLEMPPYDRLFNPTLTALRELGGSGSIEEIAEQVITDLKPLPEVIQQSHGRGGQSELEYRLAWSRTYLKKFGLITNSDRGVWSLTEAGRNVDQVDPREIVRHVQSLTRGRPSDGKVRETSDDRQDAVAEAEDEVAGWRDQLREILLTIEPAAFERLCQRLLRESGFIEVEVTGRSGDGGIDGHGLIRIAGLISFPVLFQAKRYRDNIGASVVRDFRGAMMGRADKGLIISTAGFTREARLEATRDGAPPIDLISGELLVEKLKELRLGVATKQVEVVEIKSGWFASL
jgi:restriction system protein